MHATFCYPTLSVGLFTSEFCHLQAANVIESLYHIFIEKDATLIEINPMAEDSSGKGEEYSKTSLSWPPMGPAKMVSLERWSAYGILTLELLVEWVDLWQLL